jgi:hypothetical protein
MIPLPGDIPGEMCLCAPSPFALVKAIPAIMSNLIMQNWSQNPRQLAWDGPYLQFRNSATSQKVADSRSDEVNEFCSNYRILPAALGPEVHSASNRNEC